MGIVIRQSLKSTIISYLGVLIGVVNVLWLSPKFLQPEQLGLSRFLIESSVLFTSFAQLGVPHITDRFFPHFKEEDKYHGFFLFMLVYSAIGFLLFCAVFIAIKGAYVDYYSNRSPLLVEYFYFIIPLTLFTTYMNVIEAYSRGHIRVVIPTFIREIFLKFANCVLIIIYGIGLITFEQFIMCLICTFGIAVVFLLLYIKKMNRFYLLKPNSTLNYNKIREMIFYGMFIILGGLGSVLTAKIDIIMLPALTSLDLTGVYVIALFIGTVIEIPKKTIGQVTVPLISNAWKDNDISKIRELYNKSSINLMLIGSLIFICIWVNIDDLFNIIPNSEVYKQGKYVVFFIGISKLIDIAVGLNGEIIVSSKYYKMILYYVLLLAVLTIGTNYLFIPSYGITGAAMAMALSIFIFTVVKFIFVWTKFDLNPFNNKTWHALLVIGFIAGIGLLFPTDRDNIWMCLLNIFIKCSVLCGLFLFLVVKFKVSDEIVLIFENVMAKVKGLIK